MASKSHDCDLTNIARSSIKMTEKQPSSNFLQFSQILSWRFERTFLQSFYTLLRSNVCNGINIECLGSDKQPKVAPKWPKFLFWTVSIFSNTVLTIRTKLPIAFIHQIESFLCDGIKIVWMRLRNKTKSTPKVIRKWPIVVFNFFQKMSSGWNVISTDISHSTPFKCPMRAMASKSHNCDLTNIARSSIKVTGKQPSSNFLQFSQILSWRFERTFLQSFYTLLMSNVCNGINIVCLGSDKQPKVAPKWPKFLFLECFNYLKYCPYDSN